MASSRLENIHREVDSKIARSSLWDNLPETNAVPCDIVGNDDCHEEYDSAENDTDEAFETADEDILPSRPLARRFASTSNLENMQGKSPLWISEEYNQIKLIVHETNSGEATNELQRRLSNQRLEWIQNDDEQLHSWNFGLLYVSLKLKRSSLIDIMRFISVQSFPFWLRLKNDEEQQARPSLIRERVQPIRYGYSPMFYASLRYGALTKSDEFRYSPNHSWSNDQQNKWSLFINRDRTDQSIEWVMEGSSARKKKQLLMNNVDQTVIIHLLPDGFVIYICQTCNMNEFNSERSPENPAKNRQDSQSIPKLSHRSGPIRPSFGNNRFMQRISYAKDKRVSMSNSAYFATVQFELRIDSSRSTNEKTQNTIRQTLKLLTEIFTSNKISVCYGAINSRPGPPTNSFSTMHLPSLIMRYSWQMLANIGYRFQVQLNEQFRADLHSLSREPHNPDDLFYRVCVFLSRLFTLEPFVNLTDELKKAVEESKRKREESAFGLISTLAVSNDEEVYVPSVTLTPTTIRIKPLKLCRTNRVLRSEQVFGKASEHFVLVDIRDENGQTLKPKYFQDLSDLLRKYLQNGFPLIDENRYYRYMHHSQSQLRLRQFWFYHHEPGTNKSFKDAYEWMGSVPNEKNVAKYASRIALCFTTTTPTVNVNDEHIHKTDDIKTKDGKLIFTDGCGTMSKQLRDDIQEKLGKRSFSAVQFRYAGAKGVVSVDPRLGSGYHLCIRNSMNKFLSDHRCFEVCKVSAPRPLYLNRQVILLLSHRKIADNTFLILQQRNHLTLVRALLRNNDAKNLLKEQLPYWFLPDGAQIDFVHEPFFRQVLITACLISTRDLLRRTRIRVPRNTARNMFGIIDEYNVLKPNEVFIQYTRLHDDEDDEDQDKQLGTHIPENCKVVISKNPCHHPGDARTFTVVNHKALEHLKDVVVFSQQGDHPASHQISGSDLDGDEYAVIWHKDLVPLQTPNATPYDYDSHYKPKLHDGPIKRKDIIDTVLEIAESDFLGRLSNLHLAYADRYGVDSNEKLTDDVLSTIELAGAISQEVDSGKTGHHPRNEIEILKQNKALGHKRPDFMENDNMESYQSKKILGKLYRSSRRTLPEWNRLLRRHRHLRHLQIRTPEDDEIDDEDEDQHQNNDEDSRRNMVSPDLSLLSTPLPNKEISAIASQLCFVYRQEIREILSLYGLSHESDLWCRKSTNSMGGELEDTAYTQLEQLVQRTRDAFSLRLAGYCPTYPSCTVDIRASFQELCITCQKLHHFLAVALYLECYNGQNGSDKAPILSLPWLFTTALLQESDRELPSTKGLLSAAMETAFMNLIESNLLKLEGRTLTFRASNNRSIEVTVHWTVCIFVEILHHCLGPKSFASWPMILSEFIRNLTSTTWEASSSPQNNLSDRWTLVYNSTKDKNEYVYAILSMKWTTEDDELMHKYFVRLIELCFTYSRAMTDDNNEYIRMSEEIILVLQRIAISETPWSTQRRTMRS